MDNAIKVSRYEPKGRALRWKAEAPISLTGGKKLRKFFEEREDAEKWAKQKQLEFFTVGVAAAVDGETSVKQAVDLFLPRSKDASKSHREKVEQYCAILSSKYGAFALKSLRASHLEGLIASQGKSSTTKAVAFRYLRMFFRWAERHDYVDKNPMRALDCPTAKPKRNILAPEQMAEILRLDLTPWMRAAVILAGFGGLRTEEVCRMNWEDVNAKTGQIHIRPGVQKDSGGFDSRIVDFTEPLNRRRDCFAGEGKLIPVDLRDFHESRISEIVTPLKWGKWPDNCLRHSFATYHLGECKNPSLTAFQMGHTSPSMVLRVYSVPAKMADWKAWWAL